MSRRKKEQLPEKVQHRPAEQKKYHHTTPKDPFVLLRPSLHPPDRLAAHSQRVGYAVQPPLRAFEDLPLLSQVAQYRPSAVQELVELRVGLCEERLFP
jgi:hypothetical protein